MTKSNQSGGVPVHSAKDTENGCEAVPPPEVCVPSVQLAPLYVGPLRSTAAGIVAPTAVPTVMTPTAASGVKPRIPVAFVCA